MSDTSEETIQSDIRSDKEDNFCRDFLRGICERKFCKYKHENASKMLNFCHDFQNNVCPRPHCKFIHCTPDEVEEYKRTGEMSNQILAEASRKSQLPGTPPICSQFKRGLCRRSFCKYRHLTKEQEEAEILDLIQNNTQQKQPTVNPVINEQPQINFNNSITNDLVNGLNNRRAGVGFQEYEDSGLTVVKKRFIPTQEELFADLHALEAARVRSGGFKGYFAGTPPPVLSRIDARSIMLEEENSILHKEIALLKRQVQDLTATNEFLLDQNAALRVSGKRNNGVNVPAVTLTNTQPGQVIRTVTASVATVPVSLATVSTCNPVSSHPVSIAGCPAVSIASPAQLLAPSQQILVNTNPATQLAIVNSSQAQLAIAQQNLANNLAAQQAQAQPQLTSQAQQLALATTTQQLTSQAQHIANQQLALASAQPQQQQITTQQLNQQLTSQAQQLALANTTQQLTSQAQQLALANTQQLTSQALAVTNVPQQLALATTNQQLLAQQSMTPNQQMEQLHRTNQLNAINTSQAIALSNATQPMVSYPIMTQTMTHGLTH